MQNRLNPFFREALEDGVVRYCAEQGIGFLAYSPTGGGRLTKKLPSHPVLAPSRARHGVSAHAVVLAWALAQSPTVIVIPSARTVDHALDSVARRRPHPVAGRSGGDRRRRVHAGPEPPAHCHRTRLAPTVKPAPTATNTTRSPRLIRPSWSTSSSASGSVAAVVLP